MYSIDSKISPKAWLVAAALIALASCADGGVSKSLDGGSGGVPPPPPPMPVEGQLGIGFSLTFGAAATSEPRDPQPGDIIPINLNADPIDVADPI